jgi:hypothetical protein
MRFLVVGGQVRGVGKTALVEDVIRAFPEAGWTAVKISSHGHGAWSEPPAEVEGTPTAVLLEETARNGNTDSSRYLAAGARRAFWLRVPADQMADGMTLLRAALEGTECAILESNAVVEFVHTALFLMVVDPALPEFKPSAQRFAARADAFIARNRITGTPWEGADALLLRSIPVFEQRPGEPLPTPLLALIRERLFHRMHPQTPPEHLPG